MSQLKRFEVGKTYYDRRDTDDSEMVTRLTIIGRTEKTVSTSEGKKHRIKVVDGSEYFKPCGNYSFSPTIWVDNEWREVAR